MKITGFNLLIVAMLFTGVASNVSAGGAQKQVTITPEPIFCPGDSIDNSDDINEGLNCYSVTGWSKGNHEINCTVIVPEPTGGNTFDTHRPLIAWANGWEQGNVLGQNTTNGYLRGLKLWAKAGPYVIAAANAWSVQESDVLACAQWVVENAGDGDIPPVQKRLTIDSTGSTSSKDIELRSL